MKAINSAEQMNWRISILNQQLTWLDANWRARRRMSLHGNPDSGAI
jgi:hypothetical protein